jgi:hypothetical protein
MVIIRSFPSVARPIRICEKISNHRIVIAPNSAVHFLLARKLAFALVGFPFAHEFRLSSNLLV